MLLVIWVGVLWVLCILIAFCGLFVCFPRRLGGGKECEKFSFFVFVQLKTELI